MESTDQDPMKTAVRLRSRVEDGFKGFRPVPVGLDAFCDKFFHMRS